MTSSEVVGAARNSADFGAGDAGSSRPIVPGPAGSMSSPSGQMALANYNTPTLPSAQEQEREDMLRFQPLDRQQSAIRLRRLRRPTLPSRLGPVEPIGEASDRDTTQRRRSSSEPHRPPPSAATVPGPTALPSVSEVPATRRQGTDPALVALPQGIRIPGRRRQTLQNHGMTEPLDMDCYDSRIVDFLDVVDPEVATLSSITNIQNSLFVPSLGKWVNRRPTYDLSETLPIPGAFPESKEDVATRQPEPEVGRSPSLSSVLSEPQYAVLSEPQYAVLPNDASLAGWPEEDIRALNDYVRHMLHSRRSKVKQRLKAFVKYASKPLGFLVTLYATLITLFGLVWVLFLIGWIYVGDRQLYVINVIDYILVALFAIVGDGLAPFRAIDTYHMIFVAQYHRKTWKMRKKLLLPELRDHNDLPTASHQGTDLEAQNLSPKDEFFPVLSDKQQARLVRHQTKLAKSHTFYKPHETETHRAFPLRLLIAVVLLLDLHSCLQMALGACTWAIDYRVRPTALTTTILCCSIASNIAAGILISIGDRRTRKLHVLDRLLKQELTEEAMKKMRKKKEKEAQKDKAKETGTIKTCDSRPSTGLLLSTAVDAH